MNFKWNRPIAVLTVAVLWAIAYLPGLGASEIRGEEGRRIMPALTMLQGGGWVLPQVSGQTYFNKPPGLNWIIAASMTLTGRQDELAARLPSVLGMLAVALAMVLLPSPVMGLRARLASALVFLTGVGVLEKARLIEIEAVYLAFAGLALLFWLSRYPNRPRGYLTWVLPSLLLAGGTLVKGPFLAAGYYPIVVAVLAYRRRLGDLLCPAHLVGIALILLIDGGWVALAMHQQHAADLTQQWQTQLGNRLWPEQIRLSQWAGQLGLALVLFMPYLLAAPLLWMSHVRTGMDEPAQGMFKGLRIGWVIGFVLLVAMPGGLSRYVLPVWPAAALALGWGLERHTRVLISDRIWKAALIVGAFVAAVIAGGALAVEGISLATLAIGAAAAAVVFALLQWRSRLVGGFALTFATACLLTLAAAEYNVLGEPFRSAGETRRPVGDAVSEMVPAGQTLCVYRAGLMPLSLARPELGVGHLPWLFYVRSPIKYLLWPQQLDRTVHYLLVSKVNMEKDELAGRIAELGLKQMDDSSERLPEDYCLYRLGPSSAGAGSAATSQPSSRGNG